MDGSLLLIIFYRVLQINGYTAIFILRRNREKEPPEVQEKIRKLDKAFRRPFILYHWNLMVVALVFLAAAILNWFFIEPGG